MRENSSKNNKRAGTDSPSEFDLLQLWDILWRGRFLVGGIVATFTLISVIYALSLPNIYQSRTVLVENSGESSNSLRTLASQYGGIAGLSGIGIGTTERNGAAQIIELVESWPFLETLVAKHNLKHEIMAIQSWDSDSGELIYNEEIFDAETGNWVEENGESKEPSSWQTYQRFASLITVSYAANTGLMTLSVDHVSPEIAFKLVQLVKDEVNALIQERDIEDSKKNIAFLQERIESTPITEMQSVFYSLIEDQMKSLMLAEVSEEYALKTVVNPMLPEVKSRPQRSQIVILGFIFGCLVGAISALVVFGLHRREQ